MAKKFHVETFKDFNAERIHQSKIKDGFFQQARSAGFTGDQADAVIGINNLIEEVENLKTTSEKQAKQIIALKEIIQTIFSRLPPAQHASDHQAINNLLKQIE